MSMRRFTVHPLGKYNIHFNENVPNKHLQRFTDAISAGMHDSVISVLWKNRWIMIDLTITMCYTSHVGVESPQQYLLSISFTWEGDMRYQIDESGDNFEDIRILVSNEARKMFSAILKADPEDLTRVARRYQR